MRRYNYFDDDFEDNIENENSPIGDFESLPFSNKIKQAVSSFDSSKFVSRIKSDAIFKKRMTCIASVVAVVVIFLCFILISFSVISGSNEKNDKFREDAGNVCLNYIKEYGVVRWEALDESKYGENQARLTGLCYARQMDFNGDGSDELMLCYDYNNVYHLEVWGYDGKRFIQLYNQEANSTDNIKDGSWVSFYHDNSKYYICKSEKENPEKVTLYALKGSRFKDISKKVSYDIQADTFKLGDKENKTDFETIKLSVFRKSKGDVIVEQVTRNIDSFGNILSSAIITTKTDAELKAQAYYDVIKKRNEKYGRAEIKTEDDVTFIDGVAVVRLIDFDGDGNDELLVGYRKMKNKRKYDNYSGEYIYYNEPVYSMDVYCWNGSVAKRIFSKDSVSRFQEDPNTFYILLKNGKKTTHICNNVYTYENNYCYTASSKVYKLKNQRFEVVYNSKIVNEYGYKRFYLDNESVYSSRFIQEGYDVPLFMNDEDEIGSNYTAIFLSGEHQTDYQSTINTTVDTIKKLYPEYSSVAENEQ